METIVSLENKKVKEWTKLNSKKYRDLENKFLVEGEHLVLEAMKAGLLLEVIIEETYEFDIDVDRYYVTNEILKKITFLSTPPKVIGIVAKKKSSKIGNKILILDEVQDPGNLGTLIRSSVAFNIDTIILSKNCVDLYNSKVLRATQGLIFQIDIINADLEELIPKIKDEYQIIGTKVVEDESLEDLKIKDKYAIILGNEGSGVKDKLLNLCDNYVYINMNSKCESLNVGVAGSIILYELGKKGK